MAGESAGRDLGRWDEVDLRGLLAVVCSGGPRQHPLSYDVGVDLTRRSFLAGLGSVSVGLLFARKLDRVLESLERDLVAEQQAPDQLPSAAEIVVQPQTTFRPERLVIPITIAALFVIEDIRIGQASQFVGAGGLSAQLFSSDAINPPLHLDAAMPGIDIRFRVRYVGDDPRGARFTAALIGTGVDGRGRLVLPIDSGCAIVS